MRFWGSIINTAMTRIGQAARSVTDPTKRRVIDENNAIAQRHLAARIVAINSDLGEASPGYVLLGGDSHAELLGQLDCDDKSVVNAGIGGLSARHYAPHTNRMIAPQKAHAAVLIIGTNDIMCRSSPLKQRARTRFEASVTQILIWLSNNADNVFVLAIPPISGGGDFPRDLKAVHLYSQILEKLCKQYGYRFADPFQNIRSSIFGLARPGALCDDVHLSNYEELIVAVKGLLATFHIAGGAGG